MIYEPPQILNIVLKRFRQIGPSRFEKVNTEVKFPEFLNLDPFTLLKGFCLIIKKFINLSFNKLVKKNQIDTLDEQTESTFLYELYGIVVHSGNLNGGHYVSYVKHRFD